MPLHESQIPARRSKIGKAHAYVHPERVSIPLAQWPVEGCMYSLHDWKLAECNGVGYISNSKPAGPRERNRATSSIRRAFLFFCARHAV